MISKSKILKELTRIEKRAKDAKFYLRRGKSVNWVQDELGDMKLLINNLEFVLSKSSSPFK